MNERSRVPFWLLLAATLGVYAVLCSWVASEPFPTPPYAVAVFDALTFSLLSVISMWSMFRPSITMWTRSVPALAVLLVVFVVAAVSADRDSFWGQFAAYLPVYGLHVALFLLSLWGLQRTKYWQRRFGNLHTWRFSIAELLIAMTVVAMLATAMRGSPFLGEYSLLALAVIASTVILAASCAFLWSLRSQWIDCLTGALGVALVLTGILSVAAMFSLPIDINIIGADLMLQAIVLSIWIAIGGILPTTPAEPAASPAKAR